MKARLKYEFFEISAKTGDNVSSLFYSSISTLNPFNEFEGNKEKLIQFLEEENKHEVSALYSSNNRDVLNITTRKENDKSRQNTSKLQDGEYRFQLNKEKEIAEVQKHDFPKRKCNC